MWGVAYPCDAANRLTQITQVTRTWTLGYDAAGNRTSLAHPNRATIAYTYLVNNWLGTITHKKAGGTTFDTITYAYDANGNRQYIYNGDGLKIRRIEGSAVTRYYHDGIRPIYETDEAGSLQAQLERDIFGNLLARKTSGGTWYYHHDGLGSTVGLTDARRERQRAADL